MSRESYARINKRSSMDRWSREMDPELWDKLDARYEDPEHRVHTDEWCTTQQEHALRNFDLNLAHFASLDPHEFEQALQHAISGRRKLAEVTDLTHATPLRHGILVRRWETEDLIDQALNTWGTFYRVSLPIEEGFEFSAIYESEGRVVASAETRTTDATFTASVAREAPGDARLHRPPFDAPVDVYLDGRHLGTTGWHNIDGD